MSIFDEFADRIIKSEGKYSDHDSDAGGKTIYGITERVARLYGYNGDMKQLPYRMAVQIIREKYWLPMSMDDIEKISPSVAFELLDTAVNQGVQRSSEYLQYSLNALNRQGIDYKDIAVDGDIGPKTVAAFKAYISKRQGQGELVLLRAINCLQGAFYLRISNNRKNEDFTFGWLLNRISI